MTQKTSYTREELYGVLLEHFKTHQPEWERAMAISYRIHFKPTPDPRKAIEGAQATLSSPGREKVPFEIMACYGLTGVDPQAEVRVGTPGFHAYLLVGIDETTGETYVMADRCSTEERKTAAREINAAYLEAQSAN